MSGKTQTGGPLAQPLRHSMRRVHRVHRARPYWSALLALLVIFGVSADQLRGWQAFATATSDRNMVATVHPLATEAGLDALRQGGNAIDAAVAACLTLGVVDGYNSGIGGGCFILIRTSDGQIVAIDGREAAPAAAHRDMFLVDGKPETRLSQRGPLASGVPGALAAYAEAAESFGRLPLADLISAGTHLARDGFAISESYAGRIRATREALAEDPQCRQLFFDEAGEPLRAGNTLLQPDLANTYEQIAASGVAWFYEGPFATTTAEWMAQNGGVMTAADFASYRTRRRTPVRTTYRGFEVIGFPPPSSGGVHVAQILNMLEYFDLGQIRREQGPATALHLVAESMKRAFADRAYWLGDPEFADVPRGLLSPEYAEQLAVEIPIDRATTVESHGIPPLADSDLFERHTTHVAAADAEGNWVAITTTVNTSFGAKVIVPGLGVVMNNQMDDFSIAPGTPNAFGLVGSEANAVAAGKRPLSSMSPTIVLRDGEPVMTVGAAGGPRIITQVVLAIVRTIDFQMDWGDAVGLPRLHHQWSPDKLYVEEGMDSNVVQELERMGHPVQSTGTAGVCQAIFWDATTGQFIGVSDPRTEGLAAGLAR